MESFGGFLKNILKKREVESVADLNADERQTVTAWENDWKAILAKPDITIDDMRLFCDNQVKIIEWQWRDLNNPDKKNERLILLHTVWSLLRNFLNSKEDSRVALEKYLEQLGK